MLQLIAAVARAAGVDPEDFRPRFEQARPGEVVRSCLDVTRARADLALDAATPLELGLARTLDWARSTQS